MLLAPRTDAPLLRAIEISLTDGSMREAEETVQEKAGRGEDSMREMRRH
jgi:hypothetical protein